jgi:hypothetical protein
VNGIVYVRRPGLGDVTSSITDAATASMAPVIEQMLVNDVMPMVLVGMVAGAAVSAMIGVWFSHRTLRQAGGVRRNPVPHTHVRLRRRRA